MRDHLERIFRAGVAASQPARILPPHLPAPGAGRTIVLALGKAAGGMAAVAEAHFGARIEGVAVVPHGDITVLRHLERIEAGHPVPDDGSLAGARRLLALAESAGPDDLVLVLLSGGASALACLPADGLTLVAKQALTRALLRAGADIGEINCVRRHLSGIKGGRLAVAAAAARLLTLAISDVAGDAPSEIGSGPTVADPTTIADAKAICRRYGIDSPRGWSESSKIVPGGFRIVASAGIALAAATAEAQRLGYRVQALGECIGDARTVGARHAALALSTPPGTALISGGELTVKVGDGRGTGGRNQEYALACAIGLAGRAGIQGLAADTDGIDGSTTAAGAFFDGTTLARSSRAAAEAQAASDAGGFFAALGDQCVTGPTGTNVNDLRIILTTP